MVRLLSYFQNQNLNLSLTKRVEAFNLYFLNAGAVPASSTRHNFNISDRLDMMKKVIIFHGTCGKNEYYSDDYPSLSNSHWLPWLQKQLLIKGFKAHTPEIFEAHIPTYEKYLTEINRYNLDEHTTLVGHSCGAGFLLRFISENKIKFNKVILVAPWLDPLRGITDDMFNFKLDKNILRKVNKLIIYSSDNDDEDINKSIEIVKDAIDGVEIRNFHNYRHFCYGDIGDKFPELLEDIVV